MREVLFRAKRVDNGEWIDGNVLQCDDGDCYIATSCLVGASDEPLMVAAYKVNSETLCQYTGLVDKNGKRIWENDIVNCGTNLRVSWHTFIASWVLSKKGWMCNHFFGEAVEPEDVEVIGNIFDTPELLKGE